MSRGHQEHDRGAAAVEFALVLPVLVAFIVGIVDLGQLLNAQLVATDAARESARSMVLTGDPGPTGNAGLPYTIPTAPAPCSDTNQTVVVQVQVQVDYWIPSYLPAFGSSATVTGEASMPCLQ
jgi:Flp pilus assembly protein TadG